ncbi:unnamed protein product [Paramecium pentaurelia]|uniref:Aldehyde dehydrogenase domain-containing protein n=1 Tax=Paramecium pentaurelia TaxID=43138 RepID=A0A8S1TE49_9CILI|nr:unnamed protein product [Paramecium pentaurelia]
MLTFDKYPFLAQLGLKAENYGASLSGTWVGDGEWTTSYNPNTGEAIAKVKLGTLQQYEQGMQELLKVKNMWAELPIPRRGDIVRQIGDEFRKQKEALGMLVALEMGKIKSEGLGEVQEIIDICDMACGLSRSLYGLVIPSERPSHFMMEQWNPLGVIGIITAFNFPVAVLGWNLALGLICGDVCVWKGAPSTNLSSIACTNIIHEVFKRNGLPTSIVFTICGDGVQIGEAITSDKRIPLVSFTGSTQVGKIIAAKVASRLARSLLELGGNNAQIVHEDANVDLALKAAVFAAVGTCGQRCTSLRRLLLHNSIAETFIQKMVKVYATIKIGNALNDDTLCGPLHTRAQVEQYKKVIPEIQAQGGKLLYGGNIIEGPGNFVQPTIFEVQANHPILQHELFMPILFIVRYDTLDEAIEINNNVPQGLSSSLFTSNLSNSYKWTGPLGSDCGIVNVNIGTSGAEIGGAFGGEKETGGGRESGSDSWKTYMRRSTCTINFGKTLPLAQGVKFDI